MIDGSNGEIYYMKIGYLSTIYHTSFILKNKSFEAINNYDFKWFLFPAGPAMMDAFASSSIDLGYIGLPPVMMGIENSIGIKCVGGGHVEGTVMIAPGHYNAFDKLGSIKLVLKQFDGKCIGAPSKGCIHDVILREMIKDHDISVKNFEWADFIPDAIMEGEIVAGVGTPSLATVATSIFDSRIVIPPHKLWPNNPSYGIVVKKELIAESPEFISDFLRAHEDACNLIRAKPEYAAKIVSSEVGFVDEDLVLATYKISPKYCASISKAYIKSTLDFIPVLKSLGYIQNDLKEKDVFNHEFIQKVHPEPPHYNSGIFGSANVKS